MVFKPYWASLSLSGPRGDRGVRLTNPLLGRGAYTMRLSRMSWATRLATASVRRL